MQAQIHWIRLAAITDDLGKIVIITGREINSIPLISFDTQLDFVMKKSRELPH